MKRSRGLEPSADERAQVRNEVVAYSESFLDAIEESPAFIPSIDKGVDLLSSKVSEQGIGIREIISLLQEHVDTPGLNPASGGHLGYIPGGGIYYSALADYLVDIFNRYAGVFYASPAPSDGEYAHPMDVRSSRLSGRKSRQPYNER